MPEHFPDMKGGACTDLAPGIAAKYFDADHHTEPFLAKTAKAICAHCVIQPQCFEAALNRGDIGHGTVAGLSPGALTNAKEWDAYDKGLRDNPPRERRPPLAHYIPTPASEFAAELRAKTELSFEERVYGVFLDVKQGKYQTLNQAIGDIALMHSQVIEYLQS